jgi:anaphase-promoting complex subunit 10
MAVQKISIHLSFEHDDSYTPSTLSIRAGTGPSDLQDVRVVTLEKPEGWITFDVSSEPNEDGDGLYVFHAVPA